MFFPGIIWPGTGARGSLYVKDRVAVGRIVASGISPVPSPPCTLQEQAAPTGNLPKMAATNNEHNSPPTDSQQPHRLLCRSPGGSDRRFGGA